MPSPNDEQADAFGVRQAIDVLAADYDLDRLTAVALLAERAAALNVADGDVAAFVVKTGQLPT